MDYRIALATKLLVRRKGNLIASVTALVIGIMVILFNSIITNGVVQGIIRDLRDYRYGDVIVTKNDDNFKNEEALQLMRYAQKFPFVEGTAPRLNSMAGMNSTAEYVVQKVNKIPVLGVDPLRDPKTSILYKTVKAGSFVGSTGQIVLGANVASDLKAWIGTEIDLKMITAHGHDAVKRFVVVGISSAPAGIGYDDSAIMTIEDMRDMTEREGQADQVLIRLTDESFRDELKLRLSKAYSLENLKIQKLEEADKEILEGVYSVIGFYDLVAFVGLLSASFAIVAMMTLMVSSRTRDIGIIKALGCKSTDILMVYILQGLIIGSIGAASGFVAGSVAALYLETIEFSFGGHLGVVLEVNYDPVYTLMSSLFSIVVGTAAAIYPAWTASRLQPIDAIRHS